jgi:hypothetical protein
MPLEVVVLHSVHHLQELVLECPSLAVLCLSRCPQLQKVDTRGLAALTRLVVTQCEALRDLEVSKCSSLEVLCVSQCAQLQEVDVRALAPALAHLAVTECDQLHDLEASGCSNLRTMDVRGLAALTQLSVMGCDQLRDLEASGCSKLQVQLPFKACSTTLHRNASLQHVLHLAEIACTETERFHCAHVAKLAAGHSRKSSVRQAVS